MIAKKSTSEKRSSARLSQARRTAIGSSGLLEHPRSDKTHPEISEEAECEKSVFYLHNPAVLLDKSTAKKSCLHLYGNHDVVV
ncbi:4014_t:CDS:2 [Paraglomus brasilianum]|uniref:4014_t:CDS:1 n=1 Tax=Paraglomus brasilianum TaxID=144538 RepID=A0A9N9FPB0_9GLOM|nr:4014_t:CDS:2 [Paraglomus brasilianum]